ncbi:MAG: hypothetical protein FJ042_00015 [Candidatus Cloacimonetes bacterium]|nr:hypothetical protein [Candidatus Cloacimonadota bacterium]
MKNRRILYLLLIMAVAIILAACESGGKIRVINRTDYPMYASVDREQTIVIPGDSEHVFEIDTDTQTFYSGEVKKQAWLKLIGETYTIFDHFEEVYVDSTQITVRAGKTLNVFLDANRASVKILNSSDLNIVRAEIYQDFGAYDQVVGLLENIAPGEERFLRVNYATPTSQFFYRVRIMDENNLVYNYGGNQTILTVGQQFLVVFTSGK